MTAQAARAGAIDNNGARKNKKLLDFGTGYGLFLDNAKKFNC